MMTFPKVVFSHIGIYVHDLTRMVRFYEETLGLIVTDRGTLPGRDLVFMTRSSDEHHQLVLASGRSGAKNTKVLNQISFKLESLQELREFNEELSHSSDISELTQINHGMAWSLYFLDPEGNRIEVFVDSPWYVEQPISDPLDLSLSDTRIIRNTETTYRNQPGFQPRTKWKNATKLRLYTDSDT